MACYPEQHNAILLKLIKALRQAYHYPCNSGIGIVVCLNDPTSGIIKKWSPIDLAYLVFSVYYLLALVISLVTQKQTKGSLYQLLLQFHIAALPGT